MSKKPLFIIILIVACFESKANEWPALKQAELEIKNHNYKTAVDLITPILEQLKLTTVEEIARGHKILGVAKCELGDLGNAKEHFETLGVFSPGEGLEPFQVSQSCYRLFKQQKNTPESKQKKSTATKESKQSKSNLEEKLPEVPSDKPSLNLTTQVQSQSSPIQEWKLWVPFGVGQFEKQEKKKAKTFLLTQSIFYSAAIASFVLFKAEQNADGTFDHSSRAEAYRVTLWSTLGSGLISSIWGVMDARW